MKNESDITKEPEDASGTPEPAPQVIGVGNYIGRIKAIKKSTVARTLVILGILGLLCVVVFSSR